MKLLVTGSAGLVGNACVALFKERGWDVIGIDNNTRAHLFGTTPQQTDYSIDIRSEEAIDSLFRQHAFDAIIHAAAQPSHDWAKREPLTDFDINARGTLLLLEATRKYCPQATFVYVSTDKVYGENFAPHRGWINLSKTKNKLKEYDLRFDLDRSDMVDMNEDMPLDKAGHRSLFGCSKTAADLYVQEYSKEFGIKAACFRCGCITGKNHQGAEMHGFLAYLAKCIREGKTYRIFGFKGKQVRDQIHANDLASAFFHYIQNPRPGEVYNIGGGPERSISILEAIKAFEEWYSTKARIEFHDPRPGDRAWDIHLTNRFSTHYPEWKQTYSLNDIINDVAKQ